MFYDIGTVEFGIDEKPSRKAVYMFYTAEHGTHDEGPTFRKSNS